MYIYICIYIYITSWINETVAFKQHKKPTPPSVVAAIASLKSRQHPPPKTLLKVQMIT